MGQRIRVLVVDDSALVRSILTQGLSKDPRIEVIGAAQNPYVARDMIVELRPDVITLDVEMPKMDGVEFLRKLMPQYPLPVLMVSALTEEGKKVTLDALEAGAVDFVTKPSIDVARGLNSMLAELRGKVKAVAKANVSGWKRKKRTVRHVDSIQAGSLAESTDKVIAIGASTGGTEAIRNVITQLPAVTPGIIIVQHMPPGFTRLFADRLNEQCQMNVKEAEDGDRVLLGRILIAPGDFHLQVKRSGGTYLVKLDRKEKVCGHRPSVEVMFKSVAEQVGANAVGIILTGMGHDGAEGLLDMRKSGARTIGQDAASCIVYGMPKVAYELGAVEDVLPIDGIAGKLLSILMEKE